MLSIYRYFSCLLLLILCNPREIEAKSQLDLPISPEIKNDAFYDAIYRIAKTEAIHTILEIGSACGEGSTEAFVRGIRENPFHPTLFCVEVSKVRFQQLQNHYINESQVHCYNVSSVPIQAFPKPGEVIQFYQQIPTKLNQSPLNLVLKWLKQDLQYIRTSKVEQEGIKKIKRENAIACFDAVLIDGSEFTGMAELAEVYGATFILLDDTDTFKNYTNRLKLLRDPLYELIEEDPTLRNGYAIFKRKDFLSTP